MIGPNGAGKSVLLSLITGALEPVAGERWVGPSIQHRRPRPGARPGAASDTPVDLIRRQRPCPEEQAVTALMRFLFTYEQVRQPISSLSGGERTRLELLLLMQSGANFLVLDEPTNHLDIDSVEMLEAALERYDGTVVFSSHDRYFLDRIADRTLEVGDGTARAYEGGYSSWYARTGGLALDADGVPDPRGRETARRRRARRTAFERIGQAMADPAERAPHVIAVRTRRSVGAPR